MTYRAKRTFLDGRPDSIQLRTWDTKTKRDAIAYSIWAAACYAGIDEADVPAPERFRVEIPGLVRFDIEKV